MDIITVAFSGIVAALGTLGSFLVSKTKLIEAQANEAAARAKAHRESMEALQETIAIQRKELTTLREEVRQLKADIKKLKKELNDLRDNMRECSECGRVVVEEVAHG